MKKIGLFIGLVLSVVSVVGVYAATITNATYYGNLQITNNGSAATNQSATFTLNTTALINAGFVNASLNNTAILNDAGADTPFMPGFNGSNPWAVWVSSITFGVGGGNATLPYTLYTGGNQSMASQLRYFPGAAGMNTTDNVSLELGGNFTINQTAFIDTSAGANKTLVYKPGAITTNITGTGNITSTILLLPTSATNSGGGATWSNPANAIDDNIATYADVTNFGIGYSSYLLIEGGNRPTNSIRYYITASSANIGSFEVYYNAAWNDYTGSTNGTGGVWSQVSLGGTYNVSAVRLRGYAPGAGSSSVNVYEIHFNYYPTIAVTATNVASGNHTITTKADSGNISLFIDAPTGIILVNPSFETAIAAPYWSTNGSFTQSSAQARNKIYSGLLTRSGADCVFWQDIVNPSQYQSQNVTLGAWIYATVANRARIAFYDADGWQYSSYHTGVAGWEWLTYTKTVNPISGIIYVGGNAANGDATAYFDGLILIRGDSIPSSTPSPDGISFNGTIVPNTDGLWQFFTANTTPYVQRHQITINGTLQLDISWQYATVFTDLTGNGHTATPTFRTSGSSSNVTANLTTYAPYTQSTSTPTSPNASASNITIAFTQPPNLYSELNITMPGAAWWNGVLDGANIPRAIFWFPWLFGWTCLIGLATHWLTKSLLIQGFVMAFLLILFSLMGGFGYWVAIEFIILAMAFIIGEKQYGF